MDNLGILVQAILSLKDITSSKNQIAKELPKLESQLQSDKNTRVKIVAGLDISKSKSLIQSQLNTLANQAKAPTVKIGVDTSGLNSTINDVQNKIIATNNGLSIKPTVDGKVIEDTDVLIKTIVSKLQTLNTVDLKAFKDNLKNILGVSSKEISADADTLIQTLKLNPEDTNSIIQSYENLMDSIRNTMSSMGKDKIVSGSSFDNNIVTSIYKAATEYNNFGQTATSTMANVKNATNSVVNTNTQVANSAKYIDTKYKTSFNIVSDVITQAETEFKKFGEVSAVSNKSVKAFDGVPEHFKDFTIQVKSATGTVQKFFYTFENVGDKDNPVFKYMLQNINEADAGVKKLTDDLEKAKATAQKTLAGFDNKSMGLFSQTDVYQKALQASNNITDFDSIATFNNAMAELEAHYQKITSYTRSGGKSLNPFINAVNDMAGMEEQIKRIKASADGLQNKSKSLIGNLGSLNRLADNVNKYAVGTEEWGQAYEKLKNKIAQVNDQIKTAKVEQKTTDSFAQKQQNMYSVIEQRMKQINQLKIQQLSTDEETSRIIQEQINSYTSQINGIKGNMSKYGYGDKALDNEVEKLKTELDYKYRIAQSEKENRVQQQSNNELLKFQTDTLREINAEYEKIVANKKAMASSKSEENKSIYANRIAESEKIIANDMEMLKDANLLTEEINQQVSSKRQYVVEQEKIIANTEQLKREQELNQVFQSQITEVEKYKNSINETIDTLQRLQNSSTFTKNASNPQVTEEKNKISALIAEYQKLITQLNGNVTPAGLEDINNRLNELNARFNDTTATAQRFEQSLKDDNGAEKLAQRVALLKARLESLAKANPKALKRFGDEINSLMATLNNNPDARTVDQVTKSVQLLGREINNADLAGKTFFQNLKDKAAKFTGWMSMTYAISLFTRSIRQAITELKEVDTLLTEISKANDKLTKSQLAQMGSNSFSIASKYGKQATDYLKGVQEMSRAGYTNAEAMGELSTAAQGAGDMTSDVANQFIIAADKAYKMNGSVEQLTKTLDGINYITNNNAVNMSELSEGFSIVSSTAASFGVKADELSAALGTMAATTQQSGSEVARAFRAILLNIRQVSDEEENIDAEGLTKYEKACNALGVSLKEVKDGVLQLRDPMQVLKELSVEYNKLSETDLKRTNLLNSVGGKLRSTQLDALLRQWSMYEEMLQQYEAGSGSMAREANNYCLVA